MVTASSPRPWALREGFALSVGLAACGLLLQLSAGPLRWSAFSWPVNVWVLAALLTALLAMHLCRSRVRLFRFLSSGSAAVPALVQAVVLTTAMGLTRQTPGGRWLSAMLTFWPFVLTYAYIVLILGLATLKRAAAMLRTPAGRRQPWRDIPFLLNHAGLFLALVAATLGSADISRLKMVTTQDEPQWRAFDEERRVVQLPFGVCLRRFILETYDDGSPRRFASDIQVLTPADSTLRATIDVNHPVRVGGWRIYQYGYDTALGAASRTSILELVRDPWLPAVYAGIAMLLAGAMFLFLGKRP